MSPHGVTVSTTFPEPPVADGLAPVVGRDSPADGRASGVGAAGAFADSFASRLSADGAIDAPSVADSETGLLGPDGGAATICGGGDLAAATGAACSRCNRMPTATARIATA